MGKLCRVGLVLSLMLLFPILAASGGAKPKKPKNHKKTSAPSVIYPTTAGSAGCARAQRGESGWAQTDVVMQADDGVQVRMTDPPVEYDEKGTIKKSYTKAELDEMKGADKTLPGYTGEYDNLAKGQTVIVYLSRKLPPKSSDTPRANRPTTRPASNRPYLLTPATFLRRPNRPSARPAPNRPSTRPASNQPTTRPRARIRTRLPRKPIPRNGCSSAGSAARCKTSLVPTRVPPRARMRRRV